MVVLFMGDSLSAGYGLNDASQGWVALLEEKLRGDGFLAAPQEVVNESVSGETSGGGLERLPELLEEHDPEVLVLQLGANDALRRQSMATLSSNLKEMIQLGKASGAKVVLVGMDLPGLASFMGAGQLEDVYEEVAAAEDVPLVQFPMAELMDGEGLMQEDRLHPTAAGQPLIQEALEKSIKQALAD